MNPKVEKIFKLPFTAKIGIAVACLALLGGGYWYMFYSALDEQFAALAEETEKLKAEVAEKRAIAANLDKFLAEVDRLDEELKKALLELPDKREIPQLLERISDKARDAGLDVRLFRPQAEAMQDFYAQVPVDIEVSGTYHQVASFFDEVGHLERIVNLGQFSMGDPKDSENGKILHTTAVATSFRFVDETERNAAPAGGEEGRRKKSS